MNRSIDICKIQNDLWKMIEMSLNSQIFTPNAFKKFESLKNSCYEKIGFLLNKTNNKVKNPIDIISYCYRGYLDLKQTMPTSGENITVMFNNRFELNKHSEEVSNFLDDFQHYIRTRISPFTRGVFIHGSIATSDYTGFSDVDATIIVKNEVMLNEQLLKELKKYIKGALKIVLKFDNLQHHGFFIIPESFLKHYPEEYLPIEIFKYAKTVNGSFVLKIKKYRNSTYAKEKFSKISKAFSDAQFKLPRNLYEVKHRLSAFMLLPTLYLQTRGEYVYKKDSFGLMQKEFTEKWGIMEEVSQIRQEWTRPKSELFNICLHMSNPWMASAIYRKCDWKIPEWLSEKLENEIYANMQHFAREMLGEASNGI